MWFCSWVQQATSHDFLKVQNCTTTSDDSHPEVPVVPKLLKPTLDDLLRLGVRRWLVADGVWSFFGGMGRGPRFLPSIMFFFFSVRDGFVFEQLDVANQDFIKEKAIYCRWLHWICSYFVSWKCTLEPGKSMLCLADNKEEHWTPTMHFGWHDETVGCIWRLRLGVWGTIWGCTPWKPFAWLFLPSGSGDMEAWNKMGVWDDTLWVGLVKFQLSMASMWGLPYSARTPRPKLALMNEAPKFRLREASNIANIPSFQPQQLKGCLQCEPPSKHQM